MVVRIMSVMWVSILMQIQCMTLMVAVLDTINLPHHTGNNTMQEFEEYQDEKRNGVQNK